jgi:negative regulator of sigma E activity
MPSINIEKGLESMDGRLKEMVDHEERISRLENKIFKLELELQKVKNP